MKRVTKAMLAPYFEDQCLPKVSDEISSEYKRKEISLQEINNVILYKDDSDINKYYNKEMLILLTLIVNYSESDFLFHLALVKYFCNLVSIADPRHELKDLLVGHWEWCLSQNETYQGGGQSLSATLETMGFDKSVLETVKERSDKLKYLKLSWYPRARFQANARNYIKAQLGLNDPDIEPVSEKAIFAVLGTCFAQNVRVAFQRRGIPTHLISVREEEPAEVRFALLTENESAVSLMKTENLCVILTLGFAEKTSWDIGSSKLERLEKFSTPESIADLIVEGVRKLKDLNPDIRVFITLSPVPLEGTGSGYSVFEANSISKAITRYALALAHEREPSFTYFPSYEIVTQVAPATGHGGFGHDDGHPRHVDVRLVDLICSLFLEAYCPWALNRSVDPA
jgi:hypothetical protein